MVRLNLQLFAKAVTDAIVNDVIRGKYGNGEARKTALKNAGYDYASVQSAVNKKLSGNSGSTPKTNNAANNNKPNNNKPNTNNNISGVDKSLTDKVNKPFSASDDVKNLGTKSEDTLNAYNEHIAKDPIDQSILDGLATPFTNSDAYNQAMGLLQSMSQGLQSGRTSWSDDIEDMFNQIKNRDPFEYDVDNDQLFQQALASAMNSGKSAMQDTIGQASALTGGYGSTYATSAGNQAYNAFIEDAYNNLPEYYNMALQAYQTEGEEMFNLLGAYMDADASEWQKMVNAYDAQAGIVSQLWNEDTFAFESKQKQLMNLGTLQLDSWSAQGNALFNAHTATQNLYEQKYKEEWDSWNTDVQNTFKLMEIYNNDYWKKETYDQTERWNDKEFGLKEKEYKISTGDTNGDGVLSASEKAAMNTKYTYDSQGNPIEDTTVTDYTVSDTEIKECKKILENGGTLEDVNKYLRAKGKAPQNETEADILNDAIGYTGDSSGGSANSKVVSGTVNAKNTKSFETTKGDNFDVSFGGKTYRVENKGKVTDKTLVEKLDKLKVDDQAVVKCDGAAYVKYSDGYYKIGATNYFLNLGFANSSGYQDLLKAMNKN